MNDPLPIYTIVSVEWQTTDSCLVKVQTPKGGHRMLKINVPIDLSEASVGDHIVETVHSIVRLFASRDAVAARLAGIRMHVGEKK